MPVAKLPTRSGPCTFPLLLKTAFAPALEATSLFAPLLLIPVAPVIDVVPHANSLAKGVSVPLHAFSNSNSVMGRKPDQSR